MDIGATMHGGGLLSARGKVARKGIGGHRWVFTVVKRALPSCNSAHRIGRFGHFFSFFFVFKESFTFFSIFFFHQ